MNEIQPHLCKQVSAVFSTERAANGYVPRGHFSQPGWHVTVTALALDYELLLTTVWCEERHAQTIANKRRKIYGDGSGTHGSPNRPLWLCKVLSVL